MNKTKAPKNVVLNIYHMLAYSFDFLKDQIDERVDAELFDNVHELLAEILSNGVSKLVKRWLLSGYLPITERTGSLKGKIGITESIKDFSFMSAKMVCSYDEFTPDSEHNRIIKATLVLLLRSADLEKPEIRRSVRNLLLYFSHVSDIEPTSIRWDLLTYNGNNAHYKILINLCYIIVNGLIIRERADEYGKYRLFVLEDKQKMSQLFEHFVCAYFRKNAPEFFYGGQKTIKWATEDDQQPTKMSADIILKSRNKALIVDTKFYGDGATKQNTRYGNITFHSENLYQIFTYVTNYAVCHESDIVSGILLYAKMPFESYDDSIVLKFAPAGRDILVYTIDLNTEWTDIVEQLKVIQNLLL